MNKQIFNSKIKQKRILKYISILLAVSFLFYALYNLKFFYFVASPQWGKSWSNFKSIFAFNSTSNALSENLWLVNWNYFLITLKGVTLGTFSGFLLAIITGYFSASNIHKHKTFSYLIKTIILLLRAFPVIVFILLFKDAFSAMLASFVLYFWFTWLWMNRYIADLIESCSTKKYYQDISLGSGKIKSFYKNIYLNIRIKFFLNFFMSYESNIRWLTILGLVGISGLGVVFGNLRVYKDSLGITLLFIALFILLVELILFALNKVLLVSKAISNPSIKDIKSLKYNWKKYVLWLMTLVYIAIVIWGLISLRSESVYSKTLEDYFSLVFKFDFTNINWNDLMLDYWLILQQGYVALVFGYIFALLYAYVLAERINKNYNVILSKIGLIIFKVIPTFIWFLIFNPLMHSYAAITIALVISCFRKLTKQIAESINTISATKIERFYALGWSKLKVYTWYIIPYINKQLLAVFIFQSEDCLRNSISYGTFANISIYSLINEYQRTLQYNKIFPVILPAYITFILFEVAFWIYKSKIWEKFTNKNNSQHLTVTAKYEKFQKRLISSLKSN
ncbi:ABC transporter permease subunit [Mycoplasma seminis]|uniref:ABC transporter permease subunit n=1 Tax=Mycoplasma seminis TaxID=512749 RepID=A0ABY9HC87_9MOLU|nr:ABC transporter permease subunit [Mycoplasma seminis]WLP85800.1 ABC transporter permease subunit [Mycoplasma seminis]